MPQSKVDDISMGKSYIRGHFKGATSAPTHARADENSLCAQKSSESRLTNNAKCVTQTSVNKQHHSYMKQIVCKAQRVVKRQQTVQNSVFICYPHRSVGLSIYQQYLGCYGAFFVA